jgi:hypothetical protein
MPATQTTAVLSAVDKIALSTTSALALALGVGLSANPAQAALTITPFTPAENATLASGGVVNFGPEGGFSAQIAVKDDVILTSDLILSGTGNNKVAVESLSCGPPFGCQLDELPPGSQVDGSLTFAESGKFNLAFCVPGPGCQVVPDGTYYFGLNAIPESEADPFGWVEVFTLDGDLTLSRYAFQDQEGLPAPIPSAVPEPEALPLFAIGAAAVLAARRRKRQKQAA